MRTISMFFIARLVSIEWNCCSMVNELETGLASKHGEQNWLSGSGHQLTPCAFGCSPNTLRTERANKFIASVHDHSASSVIATDSVPRTPRGEADD